MGRTCPAGHSSSALAPLTVLPQACPTTEAGKCQELRGGPPSPVEAGHGAARSLGPYPWSGGRPRHGLVSGGPERPGQWSAWRENGGPGRPQWAPTPAPWLRRQTLGLRGREHALLSLGDLCSPELISESQGQPGIPSLLRRGPQPQAGPSSEQQLNQPGGQRRAGPGSGLPPRCGANPEGLGGAAHRASLAEAALDAPEAPAAPCPGGSQC